MTRYETIAAWAWFWAAQVIMLVLAVLGWFVLIPACLLRAWEESQTPSIGDGRRIDRWRWPINAVYGNSEDGVSGQQALVWVNGSTRGPFMPAANPAWRAWVWSAWRNSANSTKYVLALNIRSGPHFSVNIGLPGTTRTLSGGWSVENNLPVLVLSLRS